MCTTVSLYHTDIHLYVFSLPLTLPLITIIIKKSPSFLFHELRYGTESPICLEHTLVDLWKTWCIRIFWWSPSPKPVTTGVCKLGVTRCLTVSVSFVEKSICPTRLRSSSNVTWTQTLEKKLVRKGLSQSAYNHYRHRVVLIETVFWKCRNVHYVQGVRDRDKKPCRRGWNFCTVFCSNYTNSKPIIKGLDKVTHTKLNKVFINRWIDFHTPVHSIVFKKWIPPQ